MIVVVVCPGSTGVVPGSTGVVPGSTGVVPGSTGVVPPCPAIAFQESITTGPFFATKYTSCTPDIPALSFNAASLNSLVDIILIVPSGVPLNLSRYTSTEVFG